jgi:RND superfamily putative drug exporter
MALFGRWNWWLPPGVARVFRVQPSPLEPRAEPAPASEPAEAGEPERERSRAGGPV